MSIQCNGLALLVSLADAEKAEDEKCNVVVAQAIAALAEGERARWEHGSPIFSREQVRELKGARECGRMMMMFDQDGHLPAPGERFLTFSCEIVL